MKDLKLENISYLTREILKENGRQLRKWGVQDRSPFEWMVFATEELGEVAKSISEWRFREGLEEDIVKEAIQTATLCLKIAEMFNNIVTKSEKD